MKFIYNNWLKKGLIDYLMSQEGIKKVEINSIEQMDCITIDTNIDPIIIAKYIDLYQESKLSDMFAFDKQSEADVKEYIYKAKDVCCEYCHMYFIRKLFENKDIIAVDSNFSLNNPAFNINYKIYFKSTYQKNELLKYIEKSL